MKKLIIFSVVVLLQACATVNMMPKSADEIDFYGEEGKTGWSQYKHFENFRGYTKEQVFDAAKIGLGNSGFSLRKVDLSNGLVIGEHGMTMHDWNVMAGVYFIENGNHTKVAIIAEGSKDIGFSGDVTSDGWTGKILTGMREYLNDTYQIGLKVDKND